MDWSIPLFYTSSLAATGYQYTLRACMPSHFSCVWLFVTLWTVARQVPLSMGLSRQEYWSGLSCPSPGDLSDPGIKPASLTSPALAGRFFIAAPGKLLYTLEILNIVNVCWHWRMDDRVTNWLSLAGMRECPGYGTFMIINESSVWICELGFLNHFFLLTPGWKKAWLDISNEKRYIKHVPQSRSKTNIVPVLFQAFHPPVRNNEILPFAEMQMDLETVIQSKVSLEEISKYRILRPMCRI